VANLDKDELDLPEEAFDCIVCNDVLEHLITPWQVLGKLAILLKPGGHFVASIPNVQYWGVLKDLVFEGDWRYADEGVLDVTHLRFFTRRSI
jgi:2-polyprenyl-3-methyl-5-hydroxy-6-metoxy-1,4-benzoquinol methylase